jgi:hypothetical protein
VVDIFWFGGCLDCGARRWVELLSLSSQVSGEHSRLGWLSNSRISSLGAALGNFQYVIASRQYRCLRLSCAKVPISAMTPCSWNTAPSVTSFQWRRLSACVIIARLRISDAGIRASCRGVANGPTCGRCCATTLVQTWLGRGSSNIRFRSSQHDRLWRPARGCTVARIALQFAIN